MSPSFFIILTSKHDAKQVFSIHPLGDESPSLVVGRAPRQAAGTEHQLVVVGPENVNVSRNQAVFTFFRTDDGEVYITVQNMGQNALARNKVVIPSGTGANRLEAGDVVTLDAEDTTALIVCDAETVHHAVGGIGLPVVELDSQMTQPLDWCGAGATMLPAGGVVPTNEQRLVEAYRGLARSTAGWSAAEKFIETARDDLRKANAENDALRQRLTDLHAMHDAQTDALAEAQANAIAAETRANTAKDKAAANAQAAAAARKEADSTTAQAAAARAAAERAATDAHAELSVALASETEARKAAADSAELAQKARDELAEVGAKLEKALAELRERDALLSSTLAHAQEMHRKLETAMAACPPTVAGHGPTTPLPSKHADAGPLTTPPTRTSAAALETAAPPNAAPDASKQPKRPRAHAT